MDKKKVEVKVERKQFSAEFKQQALLRAVKDGVSAVARDLGLEPAQVYAWREYVGSDSICLLMHTGSGILSPIRTF